MPYVDDLQLITGVDVPVKELKISIHQPSIEEIAPLTENEYFKALGLFRMNKEILEIEKEEVTNWMLFNESLEQKIEGIENLKNLITNFLKLFIPKIIFGPRSLMIDIGSEIVNIEETNFDFFQKIICEVGADFLLGKHAGEDFNPANDAAKAIADKIIEGRKRIAAMNGPKDGGGFLARYARAAAAITSNSMDVIKKMTIYQLNEVVQTYLAWEAYDLDVKSRLAGAKGDGKLVHWIMRKEQNETTVGTL